MSERLDPFSVPLHGSRLIEASAGTGKTWTIAALYLRLVLGHGDAGTAFARPLAPAEILVMTFTRAATRELSERIRARLLEAVRCFRGEPAPDGDPFLAALLAAYPAGDSRNRAAWRLANAADAMDEAAVQTIEAWCQRMLREHAFDSGSVFDEALVADERALVDDAARDYWRQQVYPLAGERLDIVLDIWGSADALVHDVRALLGRSEPADPDAPPLGALLEQLGAQRHALLEPLKANWRGRTDALGRWLAGQLADAQCPFNRHKVQARFYRPWLDALTEWAHGTSLAGPNLTDAARQRLHPQGMRDALNPEATVELPDHFQHFEDLWATLAALPDWRASVRLHAASCVARRVTRLKERAGTFGFVDLQERLGRALEGPNAERLAGRIALQFPVALVDEFQDTSPRQYGIFERLYRPADNDPASALFLIGDPKQSIYGFRGADIYSYLRARRATAGRHHVLGTNHRSTEALVAAVNRLFAQAEARPGDGAFLFRSEADDPLPFEAVAARGRPERLVRSARTGEAGALQHPVAALTLCHDAELRDGNSGRSAFAALCAQEIVMLLNDAGSGFERQGGVDHFVRLRPADIAVLVRTGKEAKAVRRELGRRGVASVYLSDKESVFQSAEAADLVLWLRAIADPADTRLARAAFATALVGLTTRELRTLATDEAAWEARLEALRALRAVWQRHGVLTALRQMLHRLGLPARWLAAPDGERRLTNVLHIAELLQAASPRHEGEEALVRWLIDQMSGEGAASDDRILRLESDADLVQVITIHKSKGLEFPVVFVPFATAFRGVDKRKRFIEVVDAEGRRALDFAMSDDALATADRERLREDVRLLYVALTRARHALWVGAAALKEPRGNACALHRSGLGHLLTGGGRAEADRLPELLRAARGECAGIVLEAAPALPGFTRHLGQGTLPALPPAAVYAGDFERDWAIGSFSSLVRGAIGSVAATPALPHDEPAEAARVPPPRALAPAPWHRFPRGTLPGNFLHEQLNWLAEEGFDLDGSTGLQDRLRRRCEQQGWGHRQDEVLAWLRATTTVVMPPVGTSLQGLAAALPEMEFWLPAERLQAGDVDAICRRHLMAGRDRPTLPQHALHGMLMGFADLVFEHAGRYWVLDYKSNALGADDAAYSSDALIGAMLGHRYDVQGALYLLALHRLLRARLGTSYQPERQLGGALFLFLRGIHGPDAGCHVLPPVLGLLTALDAAVSNESQVAR